MGNEWEKKSNFLINNYLPNVCLASQKKEKRKNDKKNNLFDDLVD